MAFISTYIQLFSSFSRKNNTIPFIYTKLLCFSTFHKLLTVVTRQDIPSILPLNSSDIVTPDLKRCDRKSLPIPTNTFFRRTLPNELIAFDSLLGKQIFREALDEGHLEGYFQLIGYFSTQSDPALCGFSTLAMICNALEMDPRRQWKGIWRWYSEELFDCCSSIDHVRQHGIHFAEFAKLASCNGLTVAAHRADESNLDQFKLAVQRSTSRSDEHVVVTYSRESLGQTGDGHYSPIGGYCSARQLVLILDVARFKYPSYWVPIERLWEALLPKDTATGKSRGFFVLQRQKD